MSEVNRANIETIMLKANIEDQLNRLLTQLEDLEELKEELDVQEYQEEREETLAQLREFQAYMDQTVSGNMTLTDAFQAAQVAIQQAISAAFKTPDVIRLFMKNDGAELRKRLVALERDLKLHTISNDMYNRLVFETLTALKTMGEVLNPQEQEMYNKVGANKNLEDAGTSDNSSVLSSAAAGIKNANK